MIERGICKAGDEVSAFYKSVFTPTLLIAFKFGTWYVFIVLVCGIYVAHVPTAPVALEPTAKPSVQDHLSWVSICKKKKKKSKKYFVLPDY